MSVQNRLNMLKDAYGQSTSMRKQDFDWDRLKEYLQETLEDEVARILIDGVSNALHRSVQEARDTARQGINDELENFWGDEGIEEFESFDDFLDAFAGEFGEPMDYAVNMVDSEADLIYSDIASYVKW